MTRRVSKHTRKTTTRTRGSATTTTPRLRCRARRRSTEIPRRMHRRRVYRRRRTTNLQLRRMQKVTVSRATPRVRRPDLHFTRSNKARLRTMFRISAANARKIKTNSFLSHVGSPLFAKCALYYIYARIPIITHDRDV